MSRIELRGVSRHWGATRAVDGLSLTVEPGEFLALLGPSGCGKSTTLRLIAGLDPADAGRILIDGRDVTEAPPAGRGLAMVFQNYALFPHLSVAENILFGLTVRRVAPAERQRRLAEAAALLGLGALLARKPGQLSGGQRQRVALGRAIVAQARVCLMDEPLSNLDAQLRQQMRAEIRELQQRLGMTMVYVTHDQTEAMTMADRVALLRGGRLEQLGTPQELYERPASAFAAGFIGAPAMNLIDAALCPPALGPARAGLRLGVRPERLRLVAPTAGLAARVLGSEYLGAETLLACEAGAAPAAQRLLLRLPGRVELARGAAVGLAWEAADLHAFDAASGARVEPGPAPHKT